VTIDPTEFVDLARGEEILQQLSDADRKVAVASSSVVVVAAGLLLDIVAEDLSPEFQEVLENMSPPERWGFILSLTYSLEMGFQDKLDEAMSLGVSILRDALRAGPDDTQEEEETSH
jgi:hypothetical protein